MREPRPAKSFRAAADRIVRQESATPSVITRLLAGRQPSRLATIGSDPWSVRLGALAMLGQYDALRVVGAADAHAYNVGDDPMADGAIATAVDEARRSRSTVQIHTALRLADDRVAGAAMIVPHSAPELPDVTLVALRVGRFFSSADAVTATGVAEIIALELGRDAGAVRDEAHRRQAFALFELARLSLFGADAAEQLRNAAELIVGALTHEVAQIWSLRDDETLELVAAYPDDRRRNERINPGAERALAQALHQRRVVRIGHGALRDWVPDETRDLVIAPLVADDRAVGLLVLGRTRDRYTAADEDLAEILASFVAKLAASLPPDAEPVWEREPELARG
ncbi:MAG TPA: GAF domain-containing protein [Candidatus Limnocylindria bacterium]